MSLITQCPSIAQVADTTGPRLVQMVALRNCEVMRPHTNSESGAIFWHFPLVTPTKMGKLQFGGPQTSGDMCNV